MQQKFSGALVGVLLAFSLFLPQSARAADGFDNNYFGSDANSLLVTLNGDPKAILFGPGNLSVSAFNLHVPNGSFRDLGVLSSFTLTQAVSHLRSAYFDRVVSTTLYYRVYIDGETPPAWSTLDLDSETPLDPDSCYTTSQNNTWSGPASIDLLAGLAAGFYVMEFYIQSELFDVGAEAPDPCNINASLQCSLAESHSGRFISSRFNTTDPSACNLAAQLAGMSNPSRVTFQLATAALPKLETASFSPVVWPNPALDELRFQLPEGYAGQLTARIADVTGRWMVQRALPSGLSASVPVGDLPEGLYFLVLFDDKARRLGAARFLKN
jgi:hypothetical protein